MELYHKELALFIDKAIDLELALARLYEVYARHITRDFGFWTKLETEEKNHAALLYTGKQFLEHNRFPNSLLPGSVQEIEKTIGIIGQVIEEFTARPDRDLAFEQALQLEKS